MPRRAVPLHETIEKERQVLELRLASVRWEDIAKTVGYASAGAAYNAYKRALVRTLQEPADEIRNQERERLDRMSNSIYRQALQGDLQAIQLMLRIMDRRAKLIGLDAPVKQQMEVTTFEGGTDIDREVQKLVNLLSKSGGEQSTVDTPTGTTEPTTT